VTNAISDDPNTSAAVVISIFTDPLPLHCRDARTPNASYREHLDLDASHHPDKLVPLQSAATGLGDRGSAGEYLPICVILFPEEKRKVFTLVRIRANASN
jgi:hypothetical protein